jgi:tRNA(Ile)-lysidine synthase TilS/MesJ
MGEQALLDAVAPFRSTDGSPDVIVAFSGGRDSSYGLHYVKKHLGMNPVAFTYDWGMVTDLARRNQARVCGKLGVEHILRSADIVAKRRFVRKNVEAARRSPSWAWSRCSPPATRSSITTRASCGRRPASSWWSSAPAT